MTLAKFLKTDLVFILTCVFMLSWTIGKSMITWLLPAKSQKM